MCAVCLLVMTWDYRICAWKGHRLIDPEMLWASTMGVLHARDIPKNHWGDTKHMHNHARTHSRTHINIYLSLPNIRIVMLSIKAMLFTQDGNKGGMFEPEGLTERLHKAENNWFVGCQIEANIRRFGRRTQSCSLGLFDRTDTETIV